MNTKRIGRLLIVLFLLAAVPGMTAVMAQGQDPGEPQTSAAWNIFESEPNNTFATADRIRLNDVVAGLIEGDQGDPNCWGVDYFRFTIPSERFVLFDTTGISSVDTEICLFDEARQELACAQDTDFFYRNLPAGAYYIRLANTYDDYCGNYFVAVSSPVLVSAAAGVESGELPGLLWGFSSDDLLAFSTLNTGQEKWMMVFEGAALGVTDLWNVATRDGNTDELLLGFGKNQVLTDVDAVTPLDTVIYDPSDYSPLYGGDFHRWLSGREQGLTLSREKVDAIDGWVRGNGRCSGFPMSTVGAAAVPTWGGRVLRQDDEDVMCKAFNGNWQPWNAFFDVDGVHDAPSGEPLPGQIPGLAGEDVIAMAYDDAHDVIFLVIQGTGTIWGHPVTQKDIFAINYPGYTWGGIVWHGPDHGWNYNIDAIESGGN